MLDLTFLTSNMVKVAHVRYISARLPVRVIGFRQRTYHANYFEPRVSSRRKLLEASYRSALDQCRKAGISTRHHFFMLEDTSVRIDALSTSDRDVPGLDIKYWIESISFPDLDSALKKTGNYRGAHVRSDVLLHIPEMYRSMLGVTEDYCIFTGQQDGYVVEAEVDFQSNVVFPWLDNRTFNKWFCPNDSNLPLGAMNIREADKVDFRRKALDKMFTFLDDSTVLKRTPVQINLPLDYGVNFILCGYTCAGKTTASQFLARRYGYLHIEASDFMHLSYHYRHGYQSDISIGDFAEQALAQMPHIVAENVAEYILEEESAPVVVSGFRSIEEIDWLQDHLSFTGKTFRIVFIDAEQEERFSRMRARNRMGDRVSAANFRVRDGQQRRMGLGQIQDSDRVEIWMNDRSLESYLRYIESQVVVEYLEDNEIEKAINSLEDIQNVKLEDAILVALLSVWTMNEARRYYSPTEIASIINKKIFPHIRPKHKENVHRYFNQDFYAYYDVNIRRRGRARVYRLSNTGYGRSLRSLRSLIANSKNQSVIEQTVNISNEDVDLLGLWV